jgi:hypothetical protein
MKLLCSDLSELRSALRRSNITWARYITTNYKGPGLSVCLYIPPRARSIKSNTNLLASLVLPLIGFLATSFTAVSYVRSLIRISAWDG